MEPMGREFDSKLNSVCFVAQAFSVRSLRKKFNHSIETLV